MNTFKKFSKINYINLLLFGMLGQIAWTIENMYFNLFVFEAIAPNLDAVTLMVQLSGIVATVVTLVAGTMSDKLGNRRTFISLGYAIWGVTVALFGFISPELIEKMFGTDQLQAIRVALVLVIAGDCIMTLFGSAANDAGFNAWVTDNTESEYRGRIESILAILPLIAMLIVAGGFGMIIEAVGYPAIFLTLGIIISLCGIAGFFLVKDSDRLEKKGSLRDIFYGFKPAVIKENKPLYLTYTVIMIYGIACQIFMPYMIIYMKTYLGFSVIEYSMVFGAAIIFGAAINLYLGRLSDKTDKRNLLYIAAAIFIAGLLGMYVSRFESKLATLLVFGIFGFIMITGYIFISALCGSLMRDYTPEGDVGKLQGVRMCFSVLIPMILGPMIGNAINKIRNIPLPDLGSADVMTTQYIPAPEIFLFAGICVLPLLLIVPLVKKSSK